MSAFCEVGRPIAVVAMISGGYNQALQDHISKCVMCRNAMPQTCLGCGKDYPCSSDCPAGTGRRLPDKII